MKLLEYEAKELLRSYGLTTPAGRLLRGDVADAASAKPEVLKAQVPVGGRGKAGGVKIVHVPEDFLAAKEAMLGMDLLGYTVNTLLAEELIVPEQELYLAIALDRAEQALVLLAHRSGGIDIETAAREGGPAFREVVHERPDPGVARRAGEFLGLPAPTHAGLLDVITRLWDVATQEDVTLAEINPLMLQAGGRFICADAKIELDDAAWFRHAERDFEYRPASAQFVVLSPEGTIASLANGAGLAMATNDAIAAAGAEPANFFDVGGGTNAKEMTKGFDQIRALPGVKAIVVNIFGGITRCDEVAEAILAARAKDPHTPPLFIRLAGTNAAEGEQKLRAAGLETRTSLADCIERAVAVVGRV